MCLTISFLLFHITSDYTDFTAYEWNQEIPLRHAARRIFSLAAWSNLLLSQIRSRSLQWQIRTRVLTRHTSQEGKEYKYQAAKHLFRNALSNFEGCADRWNKGAGNRKCMQENSRELMIMFGIVPDSFHRSPFSVVARFGSACSADGEEKRSIC